MLSMCLFRWRRLRIRAETAAPAAAADGWKDEIASRLRVVVHPHPASCKLIDHPLPTRWSTKTDPRALAASAKVIATNTAFDDADVCVQ